MVETEECVLIISDTHIGRVTPTYNISVFRQRLNFLRQNLLKVKRIINRSYKLPVLNIFMLGDVIDGENIFPTQAYKQDVDADDAMDLAVDEFEDFIHSFRGRNARFKEINMWTVEGNHGRVGRRNSEKTNFDRIFYKRLADRLNGKNTNVNISKKWYNYAEIQGHGYLMFHGEDIMMYQTIPYYGIVQRAMRWKSGGIHESYFNYVCLGHFHTVGDQFWNDFRVLLNGTFVTDDDFVQKKLGMKEIPKFWFFGVNEERPMTWTYLLELTRLG